jgi:hypothetical protein
MAATITGTAGLAVQGMQYLLNDITQGQSALTQSGQFNLANYGLTYGTGAVLSNGLVPVNDWYLNSFSLATATAKNVVLNGGADANPFGVALAFTKVKLIIVSISVVDLLNNFGTIGPQGVTSAAQLCFGGTGATAYATFFGPTIFCGGAAGWTTNSTSASILPVNNTSSGTLVFQLFIAGTK